MSFLTIILAIAALGALAVWRWVGPWLKFRGRRVVRCPENLRPAGVTVDAWHAAGGLRLSTCSRWPEKVGCGQQCLSEIAAAPSDCLVRTIAARWYHGKRCAVCRLAIENVEWGPSEPALMLADRTTVQWKQVPSEKLTETLETALPVCFACHMATTLVREHPELAIERNRPI